MITLRAAGAGDEAAALAAHPEAEFMEELRERLEAADIADPTPEVDALVEALSLDSGVEPAFEAAMRAVRAAGAASGAGAPDRYAAAVDLLRSAAAEFAASIADGHMADIVALEVARGFVDAAEAVLAGAPDGLADEAASLLADTRASLPATEGDA